MCVLVCADSETNGVSAYTDGDDDVPILSNKSEGELLSDAKTNVDRNESNILHITRAATCTVHVHA